MKNSGIQNQDKREWQQAGTSSESENNASPKLSGNLEQMLDQISHEFGNSPDLLIRRIQIGNELHAAVINISGLVDTDTVNRFVTSILENSSELANAQESGNSIEPECRLPFLLNKAQEMGEAERKSDWKGMMTSVLSGYTLVLLEGCTEGILVETKGGEMRIVSEPSSKVVVRGPKDGFVESLGTNIALVRRRIKMLKLRVEPIKVGTVSPTDVAILYIKDVAEDKLVEEVRSRLKKIDIEAVLESGYIEEFILDKTFTPFPTIYNTERPDEVATNLLEGRVALIVDGTPFVLVMPVLLAQFFQSTDDYSQRFDIAILMRFVRYLSFVLLLLGPAIYVAMTTFHYEMIPTTMLINLLAQRENVPFPAAVEAVLMEVAFEILREAGVRMPRAVGQAVSVVGALILGQAVVEAGIITPAMVIVVALTGIASFAVPVGNLSTAGRIVRFGFIILASTFGFYGITLGLIVLVAHLNSLRSFGVPYLAPLSPFAWHGQRDTFFRVPMWMVHIRPHSLDKTNKDSKDYNPESEKGNDGNLPE